MREAKKKTVANKTEREKERIRLMLQSRKKKLFGFIKWWQVEKAKNAKKLEKLFN